MSEQDGDILFSCWFKFWSYCIRTVDLWRMASL